MGYLVDVLIHAYRVLGFEQAVSGGRGIRSVGAGPAEAREGIVTAAPRRGLRRARLETLVPPGSRPARCTLTDHDRVPGAGRAVHGIAPLVNRRQNVAIGLTGLPDVPAKRTGATARWQSHWLEELPQEITASGNQISALYPQWTDFSELRAHHDPKGKFTNPFLDRLV